jgi:16S rRNA (uracil1498-N3)-methyltransferase
MPPYAHHTLPRLFVDGDLSLTQQIVLPADQTHYLSHVLRLKEGDAVRLFNGRDGEWLAKIASSGKNKNRGLNMALVEQTRPQASESALFLMCAPIKKAHFDDMLTKAAELGVTHVQPVLTSRTQVREVNTDRCRAIMIEASEQSERLAAPTINSPISLEKLTQSWPKDVLPIVCAERGETRPAGESFLTLSPQPAAIITGPEGGFMPEEFVLLRSLPDARFIRLGPRILRAGTAAVAALACWQALCGDWR